MRNPKEIAMGIAFNKDIQAKKELEKMIGKPFEKMTIEERRIGVTVLSAYDGIWNK